MEEKLKILKEKQMESEQERQGKRADLFDLNRFLMVGAACLGQIVLLFWVYDDEAIESDN